MPKRTRLIEISEQEAARKLDKLLVQKSNPLQTLSQTNLTLPEFKILDAYLSRIDSRKPEERFVQFERGALERLLDVEKIPLPELEKRLKSLFQVVRITDESKVKGYTLIGLFEKADFDLDENGQWQVSLCCTPAAMEYIFNIENLGYLRYRLRNVVSLTSRYSYLLYLYLENNRFRQSWTVSLEELKELLSCTARTYTEYKRFNDLVLKKCEKELNSKTDLRYTYTPVRRGRRVSAIRFTLETVRSRAEDQLTLDALAKPAEPDSSYSTEQLAFLAEACDYEFPEKEMRVLLDLVLQIIPNDRQDGMERYQYLRQKYHILQLYASKKPIASRFGYLKAAIASDLPA